MCDKYFSIRGPCVILDLIDEELIRLKVKSQIAPLLVCNCNIYYNMIAIIENSTGFQGSMNNCTFLV